jgi:hypothetical protein
LRFFDGNILYLEINDRRFVTIVISHNDQMFADFENISIGVTDNDVIPIFLDNDTEDERFPSNHLFHARTRLIDDDDERWYAFAFSKPSDPETPEVPENVVVTPGAPGSHRLFIDWNDALRATSFRVIVNNTPNPPVELKNTIVTESEVTFGDLPPGPVKITIASRNSKGGESGPSAP